MMSAVSTWFQREFPGGFQDQTKATIRWAMWIRTTTIVLETIGDIALQMHAGSISWINSTTGLCPCNCRQKTAKFYPSGTWGGAWTTVPAGRQMLCGDR